MGDTKTLVARLREDADEIDGWSAGNEAGRVRQAAAALASHEARIAELEGALSKCQSALAAMIAPDAIRQTSVINAFAMATEAEAAARRALHTEGE